MLNVAFPYKSRSKKITVCGHSLKPSAAGRPEPTAPGSLALPQQGAPAERSHTAGRAVPQPNPEARARPLPLSRTRGKRRAEPCRPPESTRPSRAPPRRDAGRASSREDGVGPLLLPHLEPGYPAARAPLTLRRRHGAGRKSRRAAAARRAPPLLPFTIESRSAA